MANLNQFYKGEAISIIAPRNGDALYGDFDADGSFNSEGTGKYAGMRTYPDDLNLENGDDAKIKNFQVVTTGDFAGKLFTIDGSRSKKMVEGSYTIELIYGEGDDNRVIVKYKSAFSLVGSAFKRQSETNTGA